MLNNDVNPKTLSRIELLKLAQTLRVTDADVMTRAELRAAIERARSPEARQQVHPISWLGKARRLLASVVERGLHLPEAATLIRGGLPVRPFPGGPPPVATVTLARIYAAQGHLVRAIGILDEVLVSDPDHELARGLREELQKLLDQRKEQERRQQAAAAASSVSASSVSASSVSASSAAASSAAEAELEVPPSEAQLAASELLGAVPDVEAPSKDEITLAGTGPEISSEPSSSVAISGGEPDSEPGSSIATNESAPRVAEAGAELASAPLDAPLETIEPEAETRRGSEAPAASAPQPSVAEAAPEPPVTASEVAAPQAPAVPAPVEPRPAGLVLIETSEPSAYLYWELAVPAAASGPSNGSEPHWVCLVAHAPRGARSERREYRFPVQRAAGAVRIEGLPRHAVVRAKLTRGEANEAPPLVVAGSVRVGCTAGGCDGGALKQAQVGFLPHPAADPAQLAQRAATHLASAAPLYY